MMEANTQATFPLVLSQHRNLPEARQPRLIFRVLRRRQTKELLALIQAISKLNPKSADKKGLELFDQIEAFVKGQLAGWENQTDEDGRPLPYTPGGEDLDRCIEDADLMELIMELPKASGMTSADKKKSALRSLSSSESPASPATPGTEPPPGAGDAGTPAPSRRR